MATVKTLSSLGCLLLAAWPGRTAGLEEDYNQWKQALNTNAATAAEHITAPPGFKVELIRSAQPGEGSWVAMAFDPKGRLVLACGLGCSVVRLAR